MTINSKGKCVACKTKKPSQEQLDPVGEAVITSGDKDQTDHSFFQCKACGSLWVELEDSGLGGHGRFWQNLTVGLF